MDQTASHSAPFLSIPIADHYHVSKDAQPAQRPAQSNRLRHRVLNLRLDDEKVQITPRPSITASVRPEQDTFAPGAADASRLAASSMTASLNMRIP
jgi:hypothetical protein